MQDNEIIELFWQRSEEALRETEQKYGRYCLSIAMGILGDLEDAEEVVNDVLLKTWNNIPPQRPDGALMPLRRKGRKDIRCGHRCFIIGVLLQNLQQGQELILCWHDTLTSFEKILSQMDNYL